MKQYKLLNNVTGWAVFAISSIVYILTCEPTASFWDCGEYISCAYKLEVGHPPGAPTFLLLGRFFSLFAGDVSNVAFSINVMSALASGFTILFLFWTITALARKLFLTGKEYPLSSVLSVLGAGIVGSIAYTFTDAFWFSAVEGEVYATSSFFTAIVFWAILKWETESDDPRSVRWIYLIALLVGLSVGVHLLNLLTIPAMAFIVYFKKYKFSLKGFLITGGVSLIMLWFIMSVIIPQVVNLFAKSELLFVNGFGLGFNSGSIIFALALIVAIILALRYSIRKKKMMLNTIMLCFTFLLLGYSTFLVVIIRSDAGTPINENKPNNPISLLSYLNREQYGDWPISYGQYYCAPVDPKKPYLDGNPVYERDYKTGRYVITDPKKKSIPNFDSRFCTFFPRMWDSKPEHIKEYKKWGKIIGETVAGSSIVKPTFTENMRYFFRYQLGWMYWRYFAWNFIGKQNDIQGHGNNLEGNWASGIPAFDEGRLGPYNSLPPLYANNPGTNHYYFLPFLLGLIGMFFQFRKKWRDGFVVTLLFLLTGVAIVVYLNQYPLQPRERDYAFAGSFYAYAIWIGFGVLAIINLLKKYLAEKWAAISVTIACFILVPGILASENWDDHDRSGRYTALDFASNYLNSCAPNAILFTNGDNDTFPLWYAQEVEGIRTDVRVINLSLLNTDWYIDQMKMKQYLSEPLPIKMQHEQYRMGTRDYLPIIKDSGAVFSDLKTMMNFALNDENRRNTNNGLINYFPTTKFSIPVDSATVVNNGTVKANQRNRIVQKLEWDYNQSYVQKNALCLLDILANNNWKRPIYFSMTTGADSYYGLENYFQLEGLAYRLVPISRVNAGDGQIGMIDGEILYENIMKKFKWGNMEKPGVYMDETNANMAMNFRSLFARLAGALTREGKTKKSLEVLEFCEKIIPDSKFPHSYFSLSLCNAYYQAGAISKGNELAKKIYTICQLELEYFFALKPSLRAIADTEIQRALYVTKTLMEIATYAKQEKIKSDAEQLLKKYYGQYAPGG